MAVRKILKKRVGPEGIEIDCEDDQSKWVDIKETTTAKYERGRGLAYQKTQYTHLNETEMRKYDDDPKITFKNPENESQTIEYLKDKGPNHGTIKSLYIEAGRGFHYMKTKVTIDNSVDNTTRKTRTQRVENETTGDHIDVERIERWQNEWGRGAVYQKKCVHPVSTEEDIEDMEGPCKEIPA